MAYSLRDYDRTYLASSRVSAVLNIFIVDVVNLNWEDPRNYSKIITPESRVLFYWSVLLTRRWPYCHVQLNYMYS